MIRRIINNFSDKDAELIFRKFDLDGDRSINFQTFIAVIQKYYYEDTVPDLKIDEAIKKLVDTIRINNLNI